MSHSSFLVPPLSCPACPSKKINTCQTNFSFIFAGLCYHCNNNCTSQEEITFYQFICYLSYETRAATIGYTAKFSCLHKYSIIHQNYVKLYTPSIKPGSQLMNDVEDFVKFHWIYQIGMTNTWKINVQIIWKIKQAKEGRKEKDRNNNSRERVRQRDDAKMKKSKKGSKNKREIKRKWTKIQKK